MLLLARWTTAMLSRGTIIFLFLSTFCAATDVLSKELFSGQAYVDHLEALAGKIAFILKDHDSSPLEVPPTSLVTTRDDNDTEVSKEAQEYVPLEDFNTLYQKYMARIKTHKRATDANNAFLEILRDLAMNKARLNGRMEGYFEKVGVFDALFEKRFQEVMTKVEKEVFEMLSAGYNSSNISVIEYKYTEFLDEILTRVSHIDKPIESNGFGDKVFLDLYHTYRTNAVFVTIWRLIMLTDPQYSEERLKFIEELQSNNKKIFNLILAANKKRENASFVMEKLFPASVLSNINELSNFPNADSPNLFNFNNVTKKFEEKYIFITLKRCGKHLLEYSSVASVTGKSNGLCDLTVLRFPIASAPETVHRPEQQFRNAFLKTREVEYSDRMITIEYSCNFCARLLEAVDTKSIYKDAGLIAVVITVGNGTVSDDVYHDPRTYKVVLDFTGRLELDSFHYKPISIHVTGYFIKRRLYP